MRAGKKGVGWISSTRRVRASTAWMPTEGVVRSWKSKKMHCPTLVDGGDRLVACRSVLCSFPIVHAVHEPKKFVMRSMSWLVR